MRPETGVQCAQAVQKGYVMARPVFLTRARAIAFLIGANLVLLGCEEGADGNPSGRFSSERPSAGTTTRVEEQDVERPDIFRLIATGLWDGRPSLGGIWVAHPDVADPERVRITNASSGKTTGGALFRRERDLPGPSVQVSSDAAVELGMLAGQPTELGIVALRREKATVVEEAEIPVSEAMDAHEEVEAAIPSEGEADTDVSAAAVDVIEAAGAPDAETTGDAALGEVAAQTPSAPLFPLGKPFIQAGIFSDGEAAAAMIETLTQAGLGPVPSQDIMNDSTVWRVLVGPAVNRRQRSEMLGRIRGLGFTDAHYVKE